MSQPCRVCASVTSEHPVVGGYTLRMCRTCYNAQRRASHARSRDDRNAKAMQRYHSNLNGTKDKHHERMANRYSEMGAKVREWFAAQPIEKQQELQRQKQARYRDKLTDCYVRRLITTTTMNVPESLIQAKKLQIQIERFCK